MANTLPDSAAFHPGYLLLSRDQADINTLFPDIYFVLKIHTGRHISTLALFNSSGVELHDDQKVAVRCTPESSGYTTGRFYSVFLNNLIADRYLDSSDQLVGSIDQMEHTFRRRTRNQKPASSRDD